MKKKDRIKDLEDRVAYLEAVLGIDSFAEDEFEREIRFIRDNPELDHWDFHVKLPAGGRMVRPPARNVNKQTCSHSKKDWIESVPVGAGYCRTCIKERYDAAGTCPHCGIKYGFAPGTGDCGCQDDYDVGF